MKLSHYFKVMVLQGKKINLFGWGKKSGPEKSDNFPPGKNPKIKKSFFYLTNNSDDHYIIDDQTSHDLHLDSVFKTIDKTLTTPGESVLYSWLRLQCKNREQLNKREGLIKFLKNNKEITGNLKKVFRKIGKQSIGDIAEEIFGNPEIKFMKYKTLFFLWYVVMFVLVSVSIAFSFYTLPVILAVSFINIGIFTITSQHINQHTHSIFYISRILFMLKKLKKIIPDQTGVVELEKINDLYFLSKKIPKDTIMFKSQYSAGGDFIQLLLEYFRVFLLGELLSYFNFYNAFLNYRSILSEIYLIIGFIDASISVSELMNSGNVCESLSDDNNKSLRAENIIHPMIKNCVGNSIEFSKGLIITGTNMSGKTTFLRALGINQLLANTIGVCFSVKFETGFFHVISSINITDNLQEGKSKYFREAERLLFCIANSVNHKTMALIDEILIGTNSEDRINLSKSVLKYLNSTESMIIASTHDIQIAEEVTGFFQPYYFLESFQGEELIFDYKIKRGIVNRANAKRILDYLGLAQFIDMN